jgi:2-iminobutanoate/2-iminopropanoate deaminase
MHCLLPVILLALAGHSYAKLEPNFTSNAGVKIYNPSSFFNTTGPWSLMSQGGDSFYIAGTSVTALSRQAFWPEHSVYSILTAAPTPGMRGIHQQNSTLAPSGLPRICQAVENMLDLAEMVGAELTDCAALVVYTTDMYRYRPVCDEVQIELWGSDPDQYPPRTILEDDRLDDDNVVEVEGTFYNPAKV